MGNIFSTFFTAGFLYLVTSGIANALPTVGLEEVGGEDSLINAAELSNSSDSTVVEWVNQVLGLTGIGAITVNDLIKTEIGYTDWIRWYSVDNEESKVYAFEFLTDNPEYFYIKVGVGSKDPIYTHLLFENLTSLAWGVVNLSQHFGTDFEIKNFGKFSHMGELGNTPIPEPTAMLLFGTGLAGLAAARKRKKVS